MPFGIRAGRSWAQYSAIAHSTHLVARWEAKGPGSPNTEEDAWSGYVRITAEAPEYIIAFRTKRARIIPNGVDFVLEVVRAVGKARGKRSMLVYLVLR